MSWMTACATLKMTVTELDKKTQRANLDTHQQRGVGWGGVGSGGVWWGSDLFSFSRKRGASAALQQKKTKASMEAAPPSRCPKERQ